MSHDHHTAHVPPSARERIEHGQKRRSDLSRGDQKELRSNERNLDPLDVLQAAGEGRVPELMPVKYARMAASPFAFFRGAAPVMAADLGRLPHSAIEVQLCGDAHVQNLGSYCAPDGKMVFDFNDFDETIRGPWEWDVKRMAASIVLAAREADHHRADCHASTEAFVYRYTSAMARFAREPILQVARHQIHREQRIRPVSLAMRQSLRSSPRETVEKLIETGEHDHRKFRGRKPLSWPVEGEEARLVLGCLSVYRESLSPERLHLFNLFQPVCVGFKVVGIGSVGVRDYIILLEGNGPDDPLFLQIKQELQSAYAHYLPDAVYEHEGRRTAEGQRAIQPLSDLLLGWTSLDGRQYLVRQLNDHKGAIGLTDLRGAGLQGLAEVAGELLARGHARSGDACVISGYCGSGAKIGKAIREFAVAYADQTEADYALFMAAIKNGKITVADPPF